MPGADEPDWLAWARELQAMAQTGLHYSVNPYDRHNYGRMLEIAACMVAAHSPMDSARVLELFAVQPGYATVKVDVRAAVLHQGRILLVQEKADGRWAMPGGWADVGEVPSAMVAREVREESGLIVKPLRLVGCYDANRGGTPLEFYHAYKLVFLCELLGGELTPSHETLDARFFDFADLPPLSLHRTGPRHLDDIRACLDDDCRPAAFD